MLVVDTNRVIATLLRDGVVRRVLYCLHMMGVNILSPKELVDELLEHIDEIAERMSMDRDQVLSILREHILSKIKLCNISEYREYLKPAVGICEKFDIEDSPFIALALKYNCPIWSNDSDLKNEQKTIKVLTTKEIIESIEKGTLTNNRKTKIGRNQRE